MSTDEDDFSAPIVSVEKESDHIPLPDKPIPPKPETKPEAVETVHVAMDDEPRPRKEVPSPDAPAARLRDGSGGGGSVPPPPSGGPPPPNDPGPKRNPSNLQGVGHYIKRFGKFSWRMLHGYSLSSDQHHRHMLAAGHWSGLFYALVIAIGVPMLGYMSPIQEYRYLALSFFILVGLLYWFAETSQITAQIRLEGLLDIDTTERQRRQMMLPYWGVAFAVVLWIVMRVARLPGYELHYGFVEFFVLVFTAINANACINVVYPLLSDYIQATASQKRFESEHH